MINSNKKNGGNGGSQVSFTAYQSGKLNSYKKSDINKYHEMYRYYSALNADKRIGRVIGMDGRIIHPGMTVK